MKSESLAAVTFDFGQTLAELDTAFLSQRLGERGLAVAADRLERSVPRAWRVYDEAIRRGEGGHPWKTLMRALLDASGAQGESADAAIDWLWTEQPARNLWRRPIPGMIDVVDHLLQEGVKVGIISNSEGKLAELVAELGWADRFEVIADSGALDLEKPDPRIFEWAASHLGAELESIVHIGDSLAADVEGAIACGMRAIWYRGQPSKPMPAGVLVAQDAAGVSAALVGFGAPPTLLGLHV
jgi:HAD superfamily hydrolase (TIGR01509 family)